MTDITYSLSNLSDGSGDDSSYTINFENTSTFNTSDIEIVSVNSGKRFL